MYFMFYMYVLRAVFGIITDDDDGDDDNDDDDDIQ